MAKGIEMLKAVLVDFESYIIDAVEDQLKRIGRKVSFEEFPFVPFSSEVRDYVDAISLDKENEIILDTSFSDMQEKSLSAFMSDNEIDHWDMIALVQLLQNINSI